MHFNDVMRVASCELGRFWLRNLSTIHLPSIGEWLWRRVSRPVQRGVSYDVSIKVRMKVPDPVSFLLILSR